MFFGPAVNAARWIVLTALLTGLGIGVHMLTLLAIPGLVFLYFYRRYENKCLTVWKLCGIFIAGVSILALILFLIIPGLSKFWMPMGRLRSVVCDSITRKVNLQFSQMQKLRNTRVARARASSGRLHS